MRNFSKTGKLYFRCVGFLNHSINFDSWQIRVVTEDRQNIIRFIEVSYELATTKLTVEKAAKKIALSEGINLLEVY